MIAGGGEREVERQAPGSGTGRSPGPAALLGQDGRAVGAVPGKGLSQFADVPGTAVVRGTAVASGLLTRADDAAVVGPPDVFAGRPGVRAAAPEVDAVHVLKGNPHAQMPDVVQRLVVGNNRPGERADGVEVGAG